MTNSPIRMADFADRPLGEAPVPHPEGRFAHASAVPAGAPAALVRSDRTTDAPPSLVFKAPQVVAVPAAAPMPGTVPATIDDPWRPIPPPRLETYSPPVSPGSHLSGSGIGLDSAHASAQIAVVAQSKARLDRARAYANRLGAHAAEIRTKLAAAAERQVAAAIGRAEPDPAEVGPLRGEAVEVDRQHRQALAILADVEAEHARHEADLATLFGSDGTARAKLAEAHRLRGQAQSAVDKAKAILSRATAHAGTVDGKLTAARADEARHDAEATARLHAALRDGDGIPAAAKAFARTSPALEDDFRHARAAVDKLTTEHATRVADVVAADLVVKGAVDAVLCAEAEAVAHELAALDARALALRVRLHCYTNRTASDYVPPQPAPRQTLANGLVMPGAGPAWQPPRPVTQTAIIGRVIASAPLPPHEGVFARNWSAESAAWSAYAMALAGDPQAEPTFTETATVPPAPPIPFAS